MAEPVRVLAASEDADRVDRWLAGELSLSRNRVQAMFKAGLVTLNGAPVRPSRRVSAGEHFEVQPLPEVTTRLVHQELKLEIIHEDAAIIVVNKPAGLVVHPGRGHPDGTLCNAILNKLDGLPGHPERPGIVHRLDMGTSGVMVVAKTQASFDALALQFSAHTAERRYFALVWGFVKEKAGSVDAALGRHPKDRLRFAVVPGGKRAVTHWRVVDRAHFKVPGGMGHMTLVECRLETGRTHQVRIHLSHLGHPVVGDPVYQRPLYKPRTHPPDGLRQTLSGLDHPLLHARLLGLTHPDTQQNVQWTREVPPDYRAVLDAAGMSTP